MSISLVTAFSLERKNLRLAIVGAGGKTTTLFRISRQLNAPVIITTTTHISVEQANLADDCRIINSQFEIKKVINSINLDGTLFLSGGESGDGRLLPLSRGCQETLLMECERRDLPLLVEADGARSLPLKAPEKHEPAIPDWVNSVIVVVGMQGINQALDDKTVHRASNFSEITGLRIGERITPESVLRLMSNSLGGLKNIPSEARKMALLNQADTNQLLSLGKNIAEQLINSYECIVVGSMLPEEERFEKEVEAIYTRIASIILAAGGSERLGQSKALFQWKGESMIHRAARIALQAGSNPVIIVAGEDWEIISNEVLDLPVQVVLNKDWKQGQSTSVKIGLHQLPKDCGAVIFQVVDQPGLSTCLIQTLVETHRQTRAKIIRPIADGSGTNPVLFDRSTFIDLELLEGDKGGRGIFHRYSIVGVPWHNSDILLDLDTPDDLEKLKYLDWPP